MSVINSLEFALPFKRYSMQIEKALINDRLRLSNISWKFRISTIYNFTVIYPLNLQFS